MNTDQKFNEERLRDFGLYGYQRKWLQDRSRFKVGMWARQTGKDFTAAGEAVLDCCANPGTTWVVLACGERQALESLAKAKDWAEAVRLKIEHCQEYKLSREALLTAAEIKWSNGSRFIALPAKPATMRGYSANVILTEFAFHDDPEGIWKAIFPTISNPLRGGHKRLHVISTPNGFTNKFFELWMKSTFSKHKVTIHDAVRDGLMIDLRELRESIGSEEGWAQEYECEFLDRVAVLLPYELIQACESEQASENSTPLALSMGEGEFFVGIDFGRKNDLTVCWTFERLGEELWTREVLALEKMSTPEQLEILKPRVQRARVACVDYTGAGVGLGDYLARQFGEWQPEGRGGKVELCHFTSALKGELFPRLRAAFERKEVKIPVSRAIREDLHGVHRMTTPWGGVTYRASRNADGHSDRCTALALALRAAHALPRTIGPVELISRPVFSEYGVRRRRLAA